MLDKVSKETKVGSLTAIAITILILGYNFMVGKDNPFSGSRNYTVKFDSAGGIAKSTPVFYNGLRIGQCKSLKLDEKGKIVTEIEIYNDLIIPDDSKIRIESPLIGSKTLKLLIGVSKKQAEDGSELMPAYTKDMTAALSDKLAPIADKADSFLGSLNALINKPAVAHSFDQLPIVMTNLSNTIAEIQQTISGLKPSLTGTLANVNVFSNNLGEYNKSITGSLKSFDRIGKQLDSVQLVKLTKDMEATIANISAITNNLKTGTGTLGKLATDQTLYNSLVATNTTLQCFVNDIKNYPEKYIPLPWGKKQRKKAVIQSKITNNCKPDTAK